MLSKFFFQKNDIYWKQAFTVACWIKVLKKILLTPSFSLVVYVFIFICLVYINDNQLSFRLTLVVVLYID